MTIDDVLFFDTETTGIPDRAAKWDTVLWITRTLSKWRGFTVVRLNPI